ncbi:MAG TPA: site-specific integrase, partial [Gaiellaceae bacterium]|nr:site-specific integrase [Gaiellaceae bacterium]
LFSASETFVRGAEDHTPKSDARERTIALGPMHAEEFWQRSTAAGPLSRARTSGCFSHPEKGSPLDHKGYAATLKLALKKAGVTRTTRPFHDGRHTSITSSAAAGLSPAALMARAGHSDFKTTQGYIDLAGETFRAEAGLLEDQLFGANGYQKPVPTPARVAEGEYESPA